MNEDRYLISCGDESYLTLWDIQTGKILMQEEDSEVYVSSIYTDGNAHYFATAFYGYWMNDNGLYSSELKIYYVDDEGRFYHYADVPGKYFLLFPADFTDRFTVTGICGAGRRRFWTEVL